MTIRDLVNEYKTDDIVEKDIDILVSYLIKDDINIDSLLRVRRSSKQEVIKDILTHINTILYSRNDFTLIDSEVVRKALLRGIIFTDYSINSLCSRGVKIYLRLNAKALDRVNTLRIDESTKPKDFKNQVLRAYRLLEAGIDEELVYIRLSKISYITSLALTRLALSDVNIANHHLLIETTQSEILIEALRLTYGTDTSVMEDYFLILDKVRKCIDSSNQKRDMVNYIALHVFEILKASNDKTLTAERLIDTIIKNEVIASRLFEPLCLLSLLDFSNVETYLNLKLDKTTLLRILVEECMLKEKEILEVIQSKSSINLWHFPMKPVQANAAFLKLRDKREKEDGCI